MNKKLIISKTVMFIFILTFIMAFKGLFGDENTLIGVTVITATLMLLERDLTSSIGKNLIKFMALNLILGIFAHISLLNPWSGIIVNFTALFIVGYTLSYNLRRPVYLPFGLQYMFMLSVPVTNDRLPLRLLSLIIGAVIIMVAQVIVNNNKLKKSSEKIIISICSELQEKVKLLDKHESIDICEEKIDSLISNLKRIIYDSRKDDFHITNEGENVINILFALERINILLSRPKASKNKKNLYKINDLLEEIKTYILSKEEFKFSGVQENKEFQEYCIAFETLEKYIIKLHVKDSNRNKEAIMIPEEFKKLWVYKDNINNNSPIFSYAIRVGIVAAIAGFISDYFNISEGRWILFTVFSLIQPYHENSIIRTKKRIVGTFIGAAMFMVLFTIFKDNGIRVLLVLFAGYMNSYARDYKEVVITATISALGAASVIGIPLELTINRILFILLGALIVFLVNKFILPYNGEKGNQYLIEMYEYIASKIAIEVYMNSKGENNTQVIKNLFLISALIEDRLLFISDIFKMENQEEFIKSQKASINFSYGEYISMRREEMVA